MTIFYIVIAVIASALFAYLLVALFKPEMFP